MGVQKAGVRIEIVCQHCGKTYRVPGSYMSRRVRCMRCDEVFRAEEDFTLWRKTREETTRRYGSAKQPVVG